MVGLAVEELGPRRRGQRLGGGVLLRVVVGRVGHQAGQAAGLHVGGEVERGSCPPTPPGPDTSTQPSTSAPWATATTVWEPPMEAPTSTTVSAPSSSRAWATASATWSSGGVASPSSHCAAA